MPSSRASAGLSILFCISGFSTMTFAASITPIRFGSSCVPPQPGTRPSDTSGSASAAAPDDTRAVVAVQRELEAAAHGRAVDERERRHGRVLEPPEHPVTQLADLQRLLAAW